MSLDTISAKEVDKYIESDEAIIIDIREKYEFENGHIQNAINIPYHDFECNTSMLSQNKTILLYCERGNLSLYLGRDLSRYGYTVKSLYGGIISYRGCLVRDY